MALCCSALGQWALQLLGYIAALPRGSWQSNSRHTPPHCWGAVCGGAWNLMSHCLRAMDGGSPGAVDGGLLRYTAVLPWGSGPWNSCSTPRHWLGVVGCGTLAVHYRPAGEQWVRDPLQYTAILLGSGGQWGSHSTLPHCWGALGSVFALAHRLTAGEQSVAVLLLRIASLLRSSR